LLLLRILRVFTASFHARCARSSLGKNVENKFCRTTSKAVIWRTQNALTRIERPSRIARARRLGYKAKQGIIVVRMRVGAGGMRKQRPTGGRRPKHLGVTRIKAAVSMKQVAERRVLERYHNMKLFGSYFLYKDSMYYWFEIILADKSHKSITKDKELRKRIQ